MGSVEAEAAKQSGNSSETDKSCYGEYPAMLEGIGMEELSQSQSRSSTEGFAVRMDKEGIVAKKSQHPLSIPKMATHCPRADRKSNCSNSVTVSQVDEKFPEFGR